MTTPLHPLAKLYYCLIAFDWLTQSQPFTGSATQDKYFLVNFLFDPLTGQLARKITMQWEVNVLLLLYTLHNAM